MACGGFVQHSRLPGGVKDGQAVGFFVFRHLQHSGHALFKQVGKLSVHRIDLAAGSFQLIHRRGLLSVRIKVTLYQSSIPYWAQGHNKAPGIWVRIKFRWKGADTS